MAASTPASSCRPYTEIPEFNSLPIPQNINVVATPGNDTSYPPMQLCCAPNRVQIVDGCYLWCEIPRAYFNNTDKNGAMGGFGACLTAQKRRTNTTDPRIIGYQFNAAARPRMMGSATQIGLWVLALSGLIYAL